MPLSEAFDCTVLALGGKVNACLVDSIVFLAQTRDDKEGFKQWGENLKRFLVSKDRRDLILACTHLKSLQGATALIQQKQDELSFASS